MSAPLTPTQLPLEAILDIYGKQIYLGNAFTLPNAGSTITDTSEDPIITISNPSGSGKSLFFFFNSLSTNNNPTKIKFYFNPTINVPGSATPAVNLRTGANTTSVATCYLGATITSNGTLATATNATTTSFGSNVPLFIIDQGKSLLLTAQQASMATTVIFAELGWYEI